MNARLGLLLCGLFAATAFASDEMPGVHAGKTAAFDARHEFVISVPEGAKRLRAWLPMPNPADPFQRIQSWKVEGPFETTQVRDDQGNTFLAIDVANPKAGDHQVVTTFHIERSEVNAELDPARTRPHTAAELDSMKRYLQDSRMSQRTPEIEAMAKKAVAGEKNPILAARKIYDAVLDRVEYHVKDPKPDAQKTMNATGTGSSTACYETCSGNCTDFHSLYAAASRSVGIPTRAVYGSFFKGPLNKKDKDQSYHCWIEFHAPGVGWIPLDVAVADIFVDDFKANENSKPRADLTVADGYHGPDPTLVDYYFGNLEPRRVSWHLGRDLKLGQAGDPLLWNPKGYAEVDGASAKVGRKLTFVETPTTAMLDSYSRPSRSFHVRYVSKIEAAEGGQQMRLWIPIPSDDPHQRITNLAITSPHPYTILSEGRHGNRMVFIEGAAPRSASEVVVEYDVDRSPYRIDPKAFGHDGTGMVDEMYLEPSTLCVVNDDIRAKAKMLSDGKSSTLDIARAFYDHVAKNMTYGKPKELAWGRGDTVYACEAGIGNCTDFHSYFISLCLAQGIPARFQIGIYGNYDKKPGEEYETGGYHCWAEFYVPGHGWAPVDISEADKDPKRIDEFFGGHTDNRVTLSTGRDLTLSPPQAGDALNYFLYPYAEIDGKAYPGVSKKSYWKDLR